MSNAVWGIDRLSSNKIFVAGFVVEIEKNSD